MHELAALTSELASTIRCSGCGHRARPLAVYPFRCPNADVTAEVDHVLRRHLDPQRVAFPQNLETNPFLRYANLLHSYHAAMAGGLGDIGYREIVETFSANLAAAGGGRFLETPFERSPELSDVFGFQQGGGIWVKDESRNPLGTHKARQLFAIALYVEVIERIGLARVDGISGAAFATSGNEHDGLAAASIARAAGRSLSAFLPGDSKEHVIARMRELGADVRQCARTFGGYGDPRAEYFRQAVDNGALPFVCDTTENALAIEGAALVGYEMIASLARSRARIDRLFVAGATGGLASGIVQAFNDCGMLGLAVPLPRLHVVQSTACYPIYRAYDRLIRRIARRLEKAMPTDPTCPDNIAARAEWVRERVWSPIVAEELAYASQHRSAFYWTWESLGQSVASELLVEFGGEWWKLIEGMVLSGGFPVVVGEDDLRKSNDLVRMWLGSDVDFSGSATLAGLCQLATLAPIDAREKIGIVVSGERYRPVIE